VEQLLADGFSHPEFVEGPERLIAMALPSLGLGLHADE
jgi:hypothetical protein